MLTSITNINFDNKKQINLLKKNFKTSFVSQNIQNDGFSKSKNVSFGNFYQHLFKKNQTQFLTRFIETSDDDYILLSLISNEIKDKTKIIKTLQKKLAAMEHSPQKVDFGKNSNIFNTVEHKLKPYFEYEDNYKSFVKLCIFGKKFGFLTDEQMKNYYKVLFPKSKEIQQLKPAAAYFKNLKKDMEKEIFKNEPFVDLTAVKKVHNTLDNLKSLIPNEEAKILLYKILHFEPQWVSTPEFEKLTEESSHLCQKINIYNFSKNEINKKIQEFEMPFDIKEVEKSFNEQFEHNKKILNKYALNLYKYFQDNNIPLHGKISRTFQHLLTKQAETNAAIKGKFDNFMNDFLRKNSQA